MILFAIAAVLKDTSNSPHLLIKDPSQDHVRMSVYPNLEYGNLYNVIGMLVDVAGNITVGKMSTFDYAFKGKDYHYSCV